MNCSCPHKDVTVTVHLPCIHEFKEIEAAKARKISIMSTVIEDGCEDCRAEMIAQDDGWVTDVEGHLASLRDRIKT